MQRAIKLFNTSRSRSSPAPSSASGPAATGAVDGGLGPIADAPGVNSTAVNDVSTSLAAAGQPNATSGTAAGTSSEDALASAVASASRDILTREVVMATLAGRTASPVIPTKLSVSDAAQMPSASGSTINSSAPIHPNTAPAHSNSVPGTTPTPVQTSPPKVGSVISSHVAPIQALTAAHGISAHTTNRMLSTLNRIDIQAFAKLATDGRVKLDMSSALVAWAFKVYGRDEAAWEEEIRRREGLGFGLGDKDKEQDKVRGMGVGAGAGSAIQHQGQSQGQGQGQRPMMSIQADRWTPQQGAAANDRTAGPTAAALRPQMQRRPSGSAGAQRQSPMLPKTALETTPRSYLQQTSQSAGNHQGNQHAHPAPSQAYHQHNMQSQQSNLAQPQPVRRVSGLSTLSGLANGGVGTGLNAGGGSGNPRDSADGSGPNGTLAQGAGAESSTPNLAQRIGNGGANYAAAGPIYIPQDVYAAFASPSNATPSSTSTPIQSGLTDAPSSSEVQGVSGVSALHARTTSSNSGAAVTSPSGTSLRDRITPSAAFTDPAAMGGNEEGGAKDGARADAMDVDSEGQWGT
jgi:hypothetical protein